MKRHVTFICIAMFMILGIGALLIWWMSRPRATAAPHLDATSVSTRPRILSDDEVQKLLVQDFELVYKVEQIPDAVRKSFSNVADGGVEYPTSTPPTIDNKLPGEVERERKAQEHPLPPLDMADPGGRFNSDVIEPGIPDRQLVFCGFSKDAAVVLFQTAGYGGLSVHLVAFRFGQDQGAWAAVIDGYSTNTLEQVRAAIQAGQYRIYPDLRENL